MFGVGFIIAIILIALGVIIAIKNPWGDGEMPLFALGGFLFLVCMVGILVNAVPLARAHVLEDLIAMHKEENQRIEENIGELIIAYKEYERGTFVELTQESPIVLVQLYPELRASELVGGLVQLHTENATKIRGLRESQIRLSVNRWWLYFGR